MTEPIQYAQVFTTFLASVRSVGTACTLAAVGIYLHQRGFVVGEGKRTLALISQQVTIPLFLFTKVLYCNQDWSDKPCPDIVKSLDQVWMLLLWPAYVVVWGLIVGCAGAILSGTPKSQMRPFLAACAFANSTGLPITLLTVVHTNFPSTTELGRIDPTLFLSVYLLTYPMLQWSIGGWLLAPDSNEPKEDEDDLQGISMKAESERLITTANSPWNRNVLNNKNMVNWYKSSRRGIGETDASLYISTVDLVNMDKFEDEASSHMDDEQESSVLPSSFEIPPPPVSETTALVRSESHYQDFDQAQWWETTKMVFSRVFQPPVIGAMLGIVVSAITPLRSVFVDLKGRRSDAPLQWMFDALYAVGLTAVPLNMMILGINLSQSQLSSSPKSVLLSSRSMAAIVVCKMLVMPIVGVLSVLVCKRYLFSLPGDIDSSVYLVMMIVFITPTANNVMVMVELSGAGAREGIARVIAWQYAIAPIILSLTMTTVVGVASQWS